MSPRDNAKRKLTGIAAVNGGAGNTFQNAMLAGSGDEMKAMSKTANAANDNYPKGGNSQNSARNNVVPFTRPNQTSFTPPAPKKRPSDSNESISLYNTQNNPQTDTSQNTSANLVSSNFYSPIAPNPANDNPKREQKSSANKSEVDANKSIDRRNVVVGPWGREQKAPIGDVLDEGAAVNISKDMADSLTGQGNLQSRNLRENTNSKLPETTDERKYEAPDVLDNRSDFEPDIAKIVEEIDNEEAETREKIDKVISLAKREGIYLTEQDAEVLLKSNFKVTFPFGMLAIAVVSDIADIVFALASMGISALSMAVNATGVGLLVGLPLLLSSAALFIVQIMSSLLYFGINFYWINYYSQNATDFTNKISFIKRYIYKKVLTKVMRRFWLKLIPFLNIIPIKTPMVYMVYLDIHRLAKKLEKMIN